MIKITRLTLVLTTACALLPIKSILAQSVTYPATSNSRISSLYCYMETQAGTTLDLSSLCATNKTTSSNNSEASAESATRSDPIGGSSAGSSSSGGGGRAASERTGGRTGNGSSSDVNPNNAVERAAQDGKNAVGRVADKAQEELRRLLGGGGSSSSGGGGGNCNNPDDIAANGSRCGGRAASERAGGRTGN